MAPTRVSTVANFSPASAPKGVPLAAADALPIELAPAAGGMFARTGEPVSFGVSLPRGWCRVVEEMSLVDADGRSVPIQTRALDRWADNSVRWVLVDTLARTTGAGVMAYRLMSTTERPRPVAPPLTVTADGDRVVVDTAAVRVELRCAGGSLFEQVRAGDTSLLDARRSAFEMLDAEGDPYQVTFERITVTEAGPVRAEVLATGRAEPAEDRGKSLELQVRLQFFAGSGVVQAFVTLLNPHAALHPGGFWDLGDPGSVRFKELRVTLALPSGGTAAHLRCSPEPARPLAAFAQPFELFQESSGGDNWASPVHRNHDGVVPVCARGYRLTSPGSQRAGLRATPVVSMRRDGVELAVCLPAFWQNFPQAIEASGDALSLALFPRRHRDIHELQGGEQKTHRIVIAFGGDAISAEPFAWCRSPLVASTFDGTPLDAALPVAQPGRAASGVVYEELIAQAIEGDTSFERKAETADEYGWRNYGELYADHEAVDHTGEQRLISHYNNQYDPIAGFATQFLRTGDRRWWTLCDALAAHVVDIDLYHTAQDKTAYNGGLFWHTDHYVDAGTATHRTYSRRSGKSSGGPSAEHNYTTGLLLHYYLTGSPQSRAAVLQLANWVIRMDDGRQSRFGWLDGGATGLASSTQSPDYHGPGRGAGNSINALLDAHRLTDDAAYLAKAEALVHRCIHPDDDLAARRLNDPERRWSYTVFLQVLGKYLEYRFDRGLVDREYEYARASLLHYARWVAANEAPYLDRPELLDYPNETWAAQDIRKAAVCEFAACHAPSEADRELFAGRAAFFFNYAVDYLRNSPGRGLTRPVVLLLAYAFQRPVRDLSLVTADASVAGVGHRTEFIAYRRRIVQRVVVTGATAAGVVIALLSSLLFVR
jgi:hypothetical protein